MTVQTRSETSGLEFHKTVREAFERANQDLTVWKISFNASTGEPVRLLRDPIDGLWYYDSLEDVIRLAKEESTDR